MSTAAIFSPNASLEKAIQLINGLDSAKFPLLLNRITQTLQSEVAEKAFSTEEKEKLQVSLGLEKDDLNLLLDSITFIIEQAAYHMIKPGMLHRHLISLHLEGDKAEAFVQSWMACAKGIVDRLRRKSLMPNQLTDIGWSLNLQTSSSAKTKQKIPHAVFQLGVNNDGTSESLTLEFDHDELYKFYNQLETIQSQLDSLR